MSGKMIRQKEAKMNTKELKKILAGLGIAGLLTGAGLTVPGGNAVAGSG